MKKYYFILAAVAAMLSAVACNKEQNTSDNPEPKEGQEVTIKVTIPEELSKVALEYTGSALALTWSAGDKIRVAEHGNASNYQDFTLSSGEGTKNATFTGTAVSAASYDITLSSGMPANPLAQTQSADESTAHLGYSATLSGVNTYDDVTFSSAWASANGGGTLAQSGALHLQVTLPSGVAETINLVTMVADKNIFGATGTMTVTLTNQEDNGNPDILDVYATIPAGGVAIPSGTGLLFKFGSTNASHTVYTRYYKTPSALNLAGGQLNLISLTGDNCDKYAGKDDDGTAAHPYLIADGYQLAAINSYASTSSTTYIKLVDDIDMTGITHTAINTDIAGYAISVNFDGNNKTISKLGKSLFYVFKGSISNLILDGSTVTMRGVFAEYLQGTGHVISNVDIKNSSATSASANVGALVGKINTGSTGVTSVTITDCDIIDVSLSGVGYVGGLLGSVDNQIIVNNCTVSRTGGSSVTVTSSANYAGGFIASLAEASHEISNCSSSVPVSCTNSSVGGFIGYTAGGTFTKDSSSGNVEGKTNIGGFIGNAVGTITISKCCSTGESVTPTGNAVGGFIGHANTGVSISDSYSTTSILNASGYRKVGGLIGQVDTGGTITVTRCYATGSITANFEAGGMIGHVPVSTFTMADCAAWNSSITAKSREKTNWSSGSIIGVTHPNCHVSNCFRSPDMTMTIYPVPADDFDQPDIDGTTTPLYWNSQEMPFTYSSCDQTSISAGTSNAYAARWAYHGKHVAGGTSLSSLASTPKGSGGLGWDGSVWNFSGSLPTLK